MIPARSAIVVLLLGLAAGAVLAWIMAAHRGAAAPPNATVPAIVDDAGAPPADDVSRPRAAREPEPEPFAQDDRGAAPSAQRPGAVSGVVLDVVLPGGDSPPQAEISWSRAWGSDGKTRTWTPATRRFVLPPGRYEFFAVAALKGPPLTAWRSQTEILALEPDATSIATLTLAPMPGLVVSVTYATAHRPRGARITVTPLDEPAPGERPSRGRRVRTAWVDDETPAAAFPGLAPGAYRVAASFRGGIDGPSATVVVGTEPVAQDLLVTGEVRDTVQVWVRSPDGTLVQDATVEAGFRGLFGDEVDFAGRESRTVPSSDGSFVVGHYVPPAYAERDLPGVLQRGEGTWFVRARHPAFDAARTAYRPGTDAEVTIRFAAPALARVSVEGHERVPAGRRLALRVRSEVAGFADDGPAPRTVGDSGTVTFVGVPAGPCVILGRIVRDREDAWDSGTWDEASGAAAVRTTLRPGVNDVTFPLPEVGVLRVVFASGVAPGALSLQSMAPDGTPREIAQERPEDGGTEVVFPDLVARRGRHRLALEERGDMFVELPAADPVVFRPRSYDAMLFHRRGPATHAPSDTEIRSGDVVIAIGGVSCADCAQMGELLADGARGAMKMTVLREGRSVELTVDLSALGADAVLEPWVR